MTIMATTAYAIARRSPRSMATAMYAPIPGSRKSREPRVNASVTVRKNHPPAIDIIEFQMSPIVADGSSSVRKVFHQPNPLMRATSRKSLGMPRNEP